MQIKKIFISCAFIVYLVNIVGEVRLAYGMEAEAPYVLTDKLNHQPISKEESIELIRSSKELEALPDFDQESQEILLSRQEEIIQQIDEINEHLHYYQSEIDVSVEEAQEELDLIIERIHGYSMANDVDYAAMSEDEQINFIKNDEEYQVWSQYIEDLNNEINYLLAEKTKLTNELDQIKYDLESFSDDYPSNMDLKTKLNESLLYPYSMNYLEADSIALDAQGADTNEFLLQIDKYLKEIVPSPYRKVSYQDIYSFFNRSIDDQTLRAEIANKEKIVLDDRGKENYTYCTELSLTDIEILSNLALKDYLDSTNHSSLEEAYQLVIEIKEEQFIYFYTINYESFEKIKEGLANYLNLHNQKDQKTFDEIEMIEDKYQIELIGFDESSQEWYPSKQFSSGYGQDYYTLDVQAEEEIDENFEEPLNTATTSSKSSGASQKKRPNLSSNSKAKKNQKNSKEKEKDSSKNKESSKDKKSSNKPGSIESIKDKLSQREDLRSKNSKSPKSSASSKKKGKGKAKDKDENESEDKKKKGKDSTLNLPDTGELRRSLIVIAVVFLIGLAVLAYNYYRKKEENDDNDIIDLLK